MKRAQIPWIASENPQHDDEECRLEKSSPANRGRLRAERALAGWYDGSFVRSILLAWRKRRAR